MKLTSQYDDEQTTTNNTNTYEQDEAQYMAQPAPSTYSICINNDNGSVANSPEKVNSVWPPVQTSNDNNGYNNGNNNASTPTFITNKIQL